MMKIYNPMSNTDILLPSETISDIYDDTTIWWVISAAFICYLADVLINNTDIISQFTSLLQETSLETATSKAQSLDFTSLSTNNVIKNIKDLQINARFNINCIHLIIFHAKEKCILLATVNPDFSLNVHEQAVIDANTEIVYLNSISDRFINSFNMLVNTQIQPISIQATIITKADLDFFYESEPFIPILDVLTEYPFNLFACLQDLPFLTLHLQNVGMNILTLEILESEFIHRNGLLNNLISLGDNINLDRQPLWSYYQAHGQLWRYIVKIRNAYIFMG